MHDRWKAAITVQGKERHLGYFGEELEAAAAYDSQQLSAVCL
jgi:hypothetical protein